MKTVVITLCTLLPKRHCLCLCLCLVFLSAAAAQGTSTLTAPANAAKVSPQQVEFNWTPVPNVTFYQLYLGSSVGSSNYYYGDGTTSTSLSLNLNPGATYHARVWTYANSVWTWSDSVFTTNAASYLAAPADGATVSPQQVQLSWLAVPGASMYSLSLGTKPGAQDILYLAGAGTTAAAGDLRPVTTYYATLWTVKNGSWFKSASTFRTAAAAFLKAPASGATVTPVTRFTWTGVPGAAAYTLWVGTSPGAQDALYYTSPTATSTTATLRPGVKYYATMWTLANGVWSSTTSTFQTGETAVLLSPANGTSNLDPALPTPISWTPIPNSSYYTLYLGKRVGANDYYNSGQLTTTLASVQLKANTTYYARLWTGAGSSLTYTDTVFSTGYPLAHLSYPLNGAADVGPFLPFTWNQADGATEYELTVSPTGYGILDFFGEETIPTVTSQYVWGLQPNTLYYAQICTVNPGPGGGGCTQSTFSTGESPALPSKRSAFYRSVESLTSQVRLMTQGFTNVPTAGTYLSQFIGNHGGNPSQSTTCAWFAQTLLDEFTMNGIVARERNISLDGTGDDHVVTEYWDPFNQKWQVADPTFGAIYFDPGSQVGQGAEDINGLLLSGELSSITPLFLTSYGDQYMTTYYMDPITLYNEVDPFGMLNAQAKLNYVPNSPLPFLNDVTQDAVATTGTFVFYFANAADSVTIQNGATDVVASPQNTEGWATSLDLSNWTYLTATPEGMHVYTFKRVLF